MTLEDMTVAVINELCCEGEKPGEAFVHKVADIMRLDAPDQVADLWAWAKGPREGMPERWQRIILTIGIAAQCARLDQAAGA